MSKTDLSIRVLGPIGVESDGVRLDVGGARQRRLLAALVLGHGGVVSGDRLADAVWAGQPSPEARRTLRTYVARLRRALPFDVIATEPPGYRLDLSREQVDVHRFEDEVERARRLLPTDPESAAEAADAALEEWRGPAFAEFADEEWVRPQVHRLEELRTVAEELRADALVDAGEPAMAIALLEAIVVEQPLRERAQSLLMLALYRAGRDAEALRSYDAYRRHLATETGLEPSDSIVRLVEQIAARDPALTRGAPVSRVLRGYRLGREIGRGSRGVVFEAIQPAFDREVALRVLPTTVVNDADFIRSFQTRAQSAARVEHPHVVPVYDYWREPDAAYFVTRYLRGGSLETVLRNGPAEVATLRRIAAEVGDALFSAHARGLSHGDVSLSNILFDDAQISYLADFGLAALVDGIDTSPERDVLEFCRTLRFLAAGAAIDDSVRIGSLRPDLPVRISSALDSVTGDSPPIADMLADLLDGWASAPRRSVAERANPYRGLEAFMETDSVAFHGRESIVMELVDRLYDGDRFLALVGPSGCGKSSIVRAGLSAQLAADRPAGWFTATMVPGGDPYIALEAALLSVAANPPGELGSRLRDRGLRGLLGDLLAEPAAELVLVIDQFEELFTTDSGDAVAFLAMLAEAVTDRSAQLRLVLTIRADFYDRPLAQHEFGGFLRSGTVAVAAMSPAELENAIRQPARRVGVEFDDGVVAALIADVLDRPSALPTLQFALLQLFDRRTGDRITTDDYRSLGGVTRALATRAEAVLDEMDDDDKERVRVLFGRLVAVEDEGVTSHRARLVDLQAVSAELEPVIARLGDARLLSFDREPAQRHPTVEIVHEALLTEWPRLSGWIHEDRETIRLQDRLAAVAREWADADRDDAYLLAGSRLESYRGWLDGAPLPLSSHEREYIRASLEAEEFRVEAQRSRRRRVLVTLGVTAGLMAMLAFAALVNWRSAANSRFESETRRLASDAVSLAADEPQLSLLLAVEAYRRDPGAVGLGALQQAMLGVGGFLGAYGPEREYLDVAWLSTDALAAVWAEGVDIFDVGTGDRRSVELDVRLFGTAGRGFDSGGEARSASHGNRMAVIVAGGVAVIDDLAQLVSVAVAEPTAVALSDRLLAVGGTNGSIEIHNLETTEAPLVIEGHDETWGSWSLPEDTPRAVPTAELRFDGVSALAFDPIASRLASSSGPIVRQWDIVTGAELLEIVSAVSWVDTQSPQELTVINGAVPVVGLHYVPDAPDVLIVDAGAGATRWDADTGVRLGTTFHPSGRSDIGQFAEPLDLEVLDGGRGAMVFPDGRYANYDMDGYSDESTEEAWRPVVDGTESIGTMFEGSASFVETGLERARGLSVSGDRLAIATADGIIVRSHGHRQMLGIDLPISGEFDFASISPDGNIVSLTRQLGDDVLVDVDTGEVRTVRHDGREAFFSTFVPDPGGSTLAVLAGERGVGRLQMYDADSWRREAVISGRFVNDVGFSADGRFAAGNTDVEVPVIDRDSGVRLKTLSVGSVARSVDFDPASARLAHSGLGGTRLFETETWELIATLGGSGRAVVSGFGPAGRYLATGHEDGTMTLLDAETLQTRVELAGVPGRWSWGNYGIHFSSDESVLLTTYEGNAQLWDTATGSPIGAPFPSRPGTTMSGAEGENLRLATIARESVIVWNLDFESWAEIACTAVGRNLSAEEWEVFGPSDLERRPTCPGNPYG